MCFCLFSYFYYCCIGMSGNSVCRWRDYFLGEIEPVVQRKSRHPSSQKLHLPLPTIHRGKHQSAFAFYRKTLGSADYWATDHLGDRRLGDRLGRVGDTM